ncbi:hypothetical protein YC2023_034378 [Brassica napus]|uniref:RING-type E3 ubiquitin transferase n=2 Tax=Brassica TaxID=3705 RepID=A0A816I5C1_BRANA|nr:unnamed protein product [Brassica napus]VDC85904.1 unnamed protein product [Brassica oleracea]
MYLVAAAVCCGLGILIRLSNGSKKMTCQLLRQAIPVNDLKGLGECLENKEINKPIVVVRGTVGSTSTVDKSCLGVFIEETASLDIEKMNAFGSVVPESKTNFLSRKEVPWYLDDGTARVYVCNYRLAEGFYDTLKKYLSPESVITYFKTLGHDGKEKLMLTDVDYWKRQRVLEIGTDLTVVGTAVRDKDGAPTIADAYRFFNGHIELDHFVNVLESGSETGGNLSLYLIALSAVLVALNMLQTDADDI